MTRKTGSFRNWGMTLCAAVLLMPWTSFSQTQETSKIDFSRQVAKAPQTQNNPGSQVENADFQNILRTVDQIEEKLPFMNDLISKLRGQLHRHERQTQQQIFQSTNATLENPSEFPRVRRGGDSQREPEPGTDLYSSCQGLQDQALVTQLHEISDYQVGVDYSEARRLMFTKLDNVGGQVECVYTGRKGSYHAIPSDKDMNCEHTWPQSHGATGVAKSDLHHLFPTDSQANSTRGSLPFGLVASPNWEEGGSKCDGEVFEIRPQHRGNAARATFYFAVRYGKRIDNQEEAALRQWNKEDPVDEAEKTRNDKIENVQHNRNPFIDHPEFVDQISDF